MASGKIQYRKPTKPDPEANQDKDKARLKRAAKESAIASNVAKFRKSTDGSCNQKINNSKLLSFDAEEEDD